MFFDLEVKKNEQTEKIIFDSEQNLFYSYPAFELINKDRHQYTKYKQTFKRDVLGLYIILGMKCNYDCSYCMQKEIRKDSGIPDFTPRKVHDFLEKIKKARITTKFIGLWGGEPLVYWKTLEILIPELRRMFPTTVIKFITNGSLLNEQKINFLKKYDISFFISYHGKEAGRTNSFTSNQDTISALKKIKDGVSVIVTWNNQSNTIREIKSEITKKKINIKEIKSYVAQPAYNPREKGVQKEYQMLDERIKNEIKNETLNDYETTAEAKKRFLNGIGIDAQITSSCGYDNGQKLALDCLGNIYPCVSVPHSVIGNIETAAEIGIDYNKTYRSYLHRNKCFTCMYISICGGACPMIHNENSKEFYFSCEAGKIRSEVIFKNAIEQAFSLKLLKVLNHYTKEEIINYE